MGEVSSNFSRILHQSFLPSPKLPQGENWALQQRGKSQTFKIAH